MFKRFQEERKKDSDSDQEVSEEGQKGFNEQL
jgi:hypothetical protein